MVEAETGTDPKWKRFEKVIYAMQKELAPVGATVTHNDHIMGQDSKTERQIDISIKLKVANYDLLIVVDCKDYEKPLDVNDIGEFATSVRDVRANKGAMICTSGYTEAAITLARTHGIDTFTYIDTGGTDWKSYVSLPTLLERTLIHSYALRFSSVGDFYFALPTTIPLPQLKVYQPDGKPLGIIRDLIARKWNNQEISHEPGEYQVPLSDHLLLDVTTTEQAHTSVTAFVRVTHEYYLGQLPIQVTGLKNEQTGGLTTKEIMTDFVDPYAIEQGQVPGWTKLNNIEELSVTAALRMGYSDVMPESTEPEGVA